MFVYVKRIGLTILLTVLIWFYADQVGETTERVSVTIRVGDNSAWYVSPRSWPCTALIRGTRRGIQSLQARAPGGTLQLEVPVEALNLEPGDHTINVARLIANSLPFRKRGLEVEQADPPTFSLHLDRFVSHPVRVEVTPPGLALEVDPPQVRANLPSQVWERYRDETIARASLEEFLNSVDVTGPTTRTVPVTVAEPLANQRLITLEPRTVRVRFQVREHRVPAVFNLVPIWIAASFPVQKAWAITEMSPEFLSITLEGPAEIMQQLQERRQEWWMELVIKTDDLPPSPGDSAQLTRPLRLALPPWATGVRLRLDGDAQPPTVQFTLARRTPPDSSG